MVTGLDNWYATLCRQCPTAEGLVVRVFEGRAKKVEGNVDYPINMGKHSARCEASLQSVYNPDRIDRPLLRVGDRGKGEFNEIGWSDALARITNQLQILQTEGKQNGLVMVTNPLSAHLLNCPCFVKLNPETFGNFFSLSSFNANRLKIKHSNGIIRILRPY